MPFTTVDNPWDKVAAGITAAGQNYQQKKITDQAMNQQKIQAIISALPALQQNPALANDPNFKALFGTSLGGLDPSIIQKTPQQKTADLVAGRQGDALTGTDPNKADMVAGVPTTSQAALPDVQLKSEQQKVAQGEFALNEAKLKDDTLMGATPRQLADHFGYKQDAQLTAQDNIQLQQAAFQSDALRAAHKALSTDPTFNKMSAAEQAGILPFFIERERNQGEWARTSLQVGDKNSQALKLIFDGAEQEYRTKMNEWQKNTQQAENLYQLATGKDKKMYGERIQVLQSQMPKLDYQEYAGRLGVDFHDVTGAVVSSLSRGQGRKMGTTTASGGTAPAAPAGAAHVQSAASLLKSGIPASDPRVSSILDGLSPSEIGQVEAMAGVKLRKAP